MATNFDPYTAWLGIPAGSRPVNHYQLLGLELFTAEPPVIAEAADERIERVQALAVGPQAELGSQLLVELAAARTTLLSTATRRAYDAVLRQQLGMPPAPQPKGPATPAPAPPRPAAVAPMAATPVAATPVAATPVAAVPMAGIPVAGRPAVAYPAAQPAMAQAVPMAAQAMPMAAQAMPMVAQAVPVAGGYMPTAVAAGMATPVMAGVPYAAVGAAVNAELDDVTSEVSGRRRFRRQSSSSWALLGIGFMVLLISGAVCLVYKDRLMAALEDRPETAEVVGEGANSQPKAIEQVAGPIDTGTAPGMIESPAQPKTGDLARADLSSKDLKVPGRLPGSEPPRMKPGVAQGRPKARTGKPLPKKNTEAKPSAPMVVLPSLRKPASAEEKAAVGKSLAAARKALGERNMNKVAEQMNLAMLEAGSPESMAAVSRMRQLEEAVKAFWKAVDQGIKDLKPVDELNYDGKTAVVINAEPGSISIRVEGQGKEYKVDKLPTGLAVHLAERWLREGDPQTKILVGAFLYVAPQGDRQKSRQLWEQAANQGADVAKLLVQLDLDLAGEANK